MDPIVSLLTTTDGRIGRKHWWLGVLCIAALGIAASIVVALLSFGNAVVMGWGGVLINLALIYPSYCIGIKRRHDRDNSGMDLTILIGLSLVINLLQVTGVGVSMVTDGTNLFPMPAMWFSVVNIAYAIFGIYMLVQLGFLKGTTGPNAYGPDPLG